MLNILSVVIFMVMVNFASDVGNDGSEPVVEPDNQVINVLDGMIG